MTQTDPNGNYNPLPAGGGPTIGVLPTFPNARAVTPIHGSPVGVLLGGIGDGAYNADNGDIWVNLTGGKNGWVKQTTFTGITQPID